MLSAFSGEIRAGGEVVLFFSLSNVTFLKCLEKNEWES